MAIGDRSSRRIPREEALALRVGEIMVRRPKTVPVDTTVQEVRRVFEQRSQRLVLLVEDGRFCGAIERGSLDPAAPADAPAAPFATREVRSTTPSTLIGVAVAALDQNNEPRLIVLDEDGITLRGLLCFNQSSRSFCIEESSVAEP